MKFPNQRVKRTYERALGKTFTENVEHQRFTDQDGYTDYDYRIMLWLFHNGFINRELNRYCVVWEYRVVK